MSYYFYRQEAENPLYLKLTCTERVEVTHPAQVTKNPVEEGIDVANNYKLDNPQITIKGFISDVGIINRPDDFDLQTWFNIVETLRSPRGWENLQLLVVQLEDKTYRDCVLTDFSYHKTYLEGVKTWAINMRFDQIDVKTSASSTTVEVARPDVKDQVAKKDSKSSATTDAGDKALTTTISGDFLASGFNTVGDISSTIADKASKALAGGT